MYAYVQEEMFRRTFQLCFPFFLIVWTEFSPSNLFSQPVFLYKNFPYKFPSQLKTTPKDFCCKYYRKLHIIFLCGKSGCEKSHRWEPCVDFKRLCVVHTINYRCTEIHKAVKNNAFYWM